LRKKESEEPMKRFSKYSIGKVGITKKTKHIGTRSHLTLSGRNILVHERVILGVEANKQETCRQGRGVRTWPRKHKIRVNVQANNSKSRVGDSERWAHSAQLRVRYTHSELTGDWADPEGGRPYDRWAWGGVDMKAVKSAKKRNVSMWAYAYMECLSNLSPAVRERLMQTKVS